MEYDEFGNYIGPDLPLEASESDQTSGSDGELDREHQGALILAEDKALYPTPAQVYPNVEIIHAEEDTQDIAEPLIKPIETHESVTSENLPEVFYDRNFQQEIQKVGKHSRIVALVGAQGHGKTSLVDALVEKTQKLTQKQLQKPLRYTHTQKFEAGRDFSVFTTPISLLLQDSNSKSFNIHFLDTPGHSDFYDEVECALKLADGALLVVDVVEGLLPATRRTIKRAAQLQLPVTLAFTKIDRLILELRLPPSECYHRLDYILDEVNEEMVKAGVKSFEPEDLLFTSAEHRWCFSLSAFARDYPDVTEKHLWGDVYFENGKFVPKGTHWSFAELVLMPIYKLYTGCMASDEVLAQILDEAGVSLRRGELKGGYLSRLRLVMSRFMEWSWLVDKLVELPAPSRTTLGKSYWVKGQILTLVRLGEILKVGDKLNGTVVRNLWQPMAQYRISRSTMYSGELALADVEMDPPSSSTEPVAKLGIEPWSLADQPAMMKAVAVALKIFPGLHATAQDSGEYLLFGPGEMFFDCVMFFLRTVIGRIDIRVSDPAVKFAETCAEQSFASCPTTLPGGGRITVLASLIPEDLVGQLSRTPKRLADLKPVLKAHGWDNMAIRSIWSFGPDGETGSNLIMNDVLGENRDVAEDAKADVVEGFLLSSAQGPLCDEEMRGVAFKVIEFTPGTSSRDGSIVSAVRRACYSAFLVASPRLLEPWYEVVVVGPLKAGRSVYENLRRRRGKVLDDRPIPGTNLYKILGVVPVIDSFGLETDIRVATKGLTKISFMFEAYRTVPGDPLIESADLAPLDVAVGGQLARNFVTKTRKRKALAATPSLAKYLDKDVAAILGVS